MFGVFASPFVRRERLVPIGFVSHDEIPMAVMRDLIVT